MTFQCECRCCIYLYIWSRMLMTVTSCHICKKNLTIIIWKRQPSQWLMENQWQSHSKADYRNATLEEPVNTILFSMSCPKNNSLTKLKFYFYCCCVKHSMNAEVRRQFLRTVYVLPPCGSWDPVQDGRLKWQALCPTMEPSWWPLIWNVS